MLHSACFLGVEIVPLQAQNVNNDDIYTTILFCVEVNCVLGWGKASQISWKCVSISAKDFPTIGTHLQVVRERTMTFCIYEMGICQCVHVHLGMCFTVFILQPYWIMQD